MVFAAKPVFPDRKSTRLNSSHLVISYAVFCLKKSHFAHHCVGSLWHLHKWVDYQLRGYVDGGCRKFLWLQCESDRRKSCHFIFFNDTATTEIYTLSLHDALPISFVRPPASTPSRCRRPGSLHGGYRDRSEEHTSELQSPCNLVCRLLLEKKK